jgi:translation initiation factor 2B subunit (eIF-2B alpha/beta/delta family)
MLSNTTNAECENFSNLLLHLEHDLGTRDTCRAFLTSMKATLPITSFKNADDLHAQIREFYDMFLHLRPRMAIIQNYLDDVVDGLLAEKSKNIEAVIDHILKTIMSAEKDNTKRNQELMKEGAKLIQNNDTILIHSHSHTVLDVLDTAKKAHKKFTVIVAEQDADKTMDVIFFLKQHEIPFTVVPEYMLSHIEDDLACMLIGAVTLKYDMNFAVDAGSKAIVSEMNSAKVPVHLLLTTNKFSYGKTKQAYQVVQTTHSPHHARGGFEYDRIKFSHDRLPIEQVTSIVTEDGSFTVPKLKQMYEEKLEEYEKKTSLFKTKGIVSAS